MVRAPPCHRHRWRGNPWPGAGESLSGHRPLRRGTGFSNLRRAGARLVAVTGKARLSAECGNPADQHRLPIPDGGLRHRHRHPARSNQHLARPALDRVALGIPARARFPAFHVAHFERLAANRIHRMDGVPRHRNHPGNRETATGIQRSRRAGPDGLRRSDRRTAVRGSRFPRIFLPGSQKIRRHFPGRHLLGAGFRRSPWQSHRPATLVHFRWRAGIPLRKTGSIWAPIAAHFCFNGSTVALQMAARYYEIPLGSIW
jgi:hypothetical protein